MNLFKAKRISSFDWSNLRYFSLSFFFGFKLIKGSAVREVLSFDLTFSSSSFLMALLSNFTTVLSTDLDLLRLEKLLYF